jgi:hypothetical protein
VTIAEALAALIVSKYDGKPLEGYDRAYVWEAIPPQFRFVDAELNIATLMTIEMLWQYLNDERLRKRVDPPKGDGHVWTDDELDAYD